MQTLMFFIFKQMRKEFLQAPQQRAEEHMSTDILELLVLRK